MNINKMLMQAVSAVLCCMCISCSGANKEAARPASGITVKSAGEDAADLKLPTQTWHVTDDRLCILFGYGYNDAGFVKSMKEELYRQYGSSEDGGLILTLVFPDDFRRGKDSVAAELPLFVGDHKVRGIILLGAPENTNFGVAHLQNNYDSIPVFPVFSFFSQDDVLGTEGTADFVLDKAQEADIDGTVKDEGTQLFVKQAPDMIRRSVKYMLSLDAPLAKDKNLVAHVRNITGKVKISRYVDPDTGLASVNHFVMN